MRLLPCLLRNSLGLAALVVGLSAIHARGDQCPNDPAKIAPGQCGCGYPDTDTDMDGIADCNDGCPNDPNKTSPGQCGCGQPDTDSDLDGFADCCSTLTNPGHPDCDGDTVSDMCEIAFGAMDCDSDGTPDVCQIASQPSLDINANGLLDSCEYIGTDYCFGDGPGSPCPCQAPAGVIDGGCKNSIGQRGRLRAVGNSQVSNDLVTMTADRMAAGAIAMLFQGTVSQAAGLGTPFGRGRLCVNGAIVRMIIRTATTGSASYGWTVSDSPLSAIGMMPPTGGTRFYQVWYRDVGGAYCGGGSTYNLTNGVEIAWAP